MPLINPPRANWNNISPTLGWAVVLPTQWLILDGIVYLRGQVSRPSAQVAIQQTIVSLPIAPTQNMLFVTDQVGAPGARLDVLTSGNVQVFWDSTRGVPKFSDNVTYLTLSGIIFPIF